MKRVIFLDRDGVINRFPGHGGYVTRIKDFRFLPGSLKALKILTDEGYNIFVISNQAGVSRGVYSQDKLSQINNYLLKGVKKAGARIKKVFYCTHMPDHNCDCRKPNIGSVKKALQLVNKNLKTAKDSFFIGDAESDIKAGHKAGCQTILVLSGKETRKAVVKNWPVKPDYIVKNLLEAVGIVTHENSCCSCLCGCGA